MNSQKRHYLGVRACVHTCVRESKEDGDSWDETEGVHACEGGCCMKGGGASYRIHSH